MVNEFTASPTVRLLRFARGHTACGGRAPLRGEGLINFPVSAATNGSNARFWWLTSFTIRDDHVVISLAPHCGALCLQSQIGAFLWGVTPVSLGKTKEMG